MIVDANLPQKEIVEIETKLGGEYNVESVINEDGTQTLNITTAEKAFDRLQWKCDNIKSLAFEFADYYSEDGSELGVLLEGLDTSKVKSTYRMFGGSSTEASQRGYTTIPYFDTSNVTNMGSMFNRCQLLTKIPLFNTSKVEKMDQMFYSCKVLTEIPELDTNNVKTMSEMFYNCTALTTIPLLNTSKVTLMNAMFSGCTSLTEVPQLDTSNVTSMSNMFYNCKALTTIPLLNMDKATNVSGMFNDCDSLTNLTLLNIKKTLIIGSGTRYGDLLNLDSLINTVQQLWDYSSGTSTYKLTMSTPSKELIANTYVKLITPTEEMITNDPYINNKMPCEVCESTDEGAMLLTDYATLKKWTIA